MQPPPPSPPPPCALALAALAACLLSLLQCAHARVGGRIDDAAAAVWADRREAVADVAVAIREALRSLAEGSDADGLPPMDPVSMVDITFCRGYGPVRANIQFPESTLAGISAVEDVTNVKCFGGDSSLQFTTQHPKVVLAGSYNLTGNFADVFAVGKGDANILLRDVTIFHRLQWRRARGEVRVRDYRGAVVPADMSVHYGNLRSETRDVLVSECRSHQQEDDVNKYFNEHWQLLYGALAPSVDFAFSAVLRDYMDVMLQRIEEPLMRCAAQDNL